jgi:hypothetical protein
MRWKSSLSAMRAEVLGKSPRERVQSFRSASRIVRYQNQELFNSNS